MALLGHRKNAHKLFIKLFICTVYYIRNFPIVQQPIRNKPMVFPMMTFVDQSRVFIRVTCQANILRYWTGSLHLDSCEMRISESWLFSWIFNPFQMFCQFQTHDKRYGRVMKIIWNINTVFLPVLFKIIKARETCPREIHILFATASRLVILFFLLGLGQISFKHTWN